MCRVRLPTKVFEANLPKLLAELARVDSCDKPVTLDFEGVEYWIPAAIVFACSMVNRWTEQARPVHFANLELCKACGYLQRMDFFERVGFCVPEHFIRHSPGTSFVEIQAVYPGVARLDEPLAKRLAGCLAGTTDPNNDVLRFSEYALGEVVANCQQHAEKPGYVSAQYMASKNWARIGVADYGIGLLESFRKNGSPYYRDGMNHTEALDTAMKPWVSSKTHITTGPYGSPSNRGIGLKMIQHMLAESLGELFIASGNAWRHYQGQAAPVDGVLENDATIPGTVVSIRFDRSQIDDYCRILAGAQQSMNLITQPQDAIFFT